MKKVVVVGKTDCTINLNKIGVPIRGKSTAILTINNIDQENELNSIIRANLLDLVEVIEDTESKVNDYPTVEIDNLTNIYPSKKEIDDLTITDEALDIEDEEQDGQDEEIIENGEVKRKPGRPKFSNRRRANANPKKLGRPPKYNNLDPLAAEELKRVEEAENKTQKRGSKVTLVTKDGIKQGKMTDSLVYDAGNNPEITKESIEAIEKLEKEELESIEKDDHKVNFIDAMIKDDIENNALIEDKNDKNNNDDLDPFIEI